MTPERKKYMEQIPLRENAARDYIKTYKKYISDIKRRIAGQETLLKNTKQESRAAVARDNLRVLKVTLRLYKGILVTLKKELPSKPKAGGKTMAGNKARRFELCPGYDGPLPERKTAASAGYDFTSPRDFTVGPHECSDMIWTGVKARMPKGEFLGIHIRSSMAAKNKLAIVNQVPIIDADYYGNPQNDGNIGLMFYNFGNKKVTIKKGERIAQGIFYKFSITDDDKATGERQGGYGSTGK